MTLNTTPAEVMAAAHPVMLQMQHITKRFPGVVALDNVSFDIRQGEVHCLMGENGAGKSTLMKIMNGIYTDYEGDMLLNGQPVHLSDPRDAQLHRIAMIHQELNLVPELRVYENIFLGREKIRAPFGILLRQRMCVEATEWLALLGIPIDPQRPLRTLRIGERQLVEIAKALSLNANILVMDEPTSALSESETARLFTVIRGLAGKGVAIIYISHRMDEIFSIADYITVLRDGKTIVSLPIDQVTRPQLIKYMVGRDITEAFEREPSLLGDVVLEVRKLELNHPGARQIQGISFKVRRGEVVGLAGLMGSGRTETLETIFGVYPLSERSGEVLIDGVPVILTTPAEGIKHSLGLVTEDRKGKSLILDLSVRANMTLAALKSFVSRFNVINRAQERQIVKQQVDELGIRTPHIETSVANLSGGNQQKVVLAKLLLTKPKVILLDEPTRGIDVGAKSQVYYLVGQLAKQGTAFIIASSELLELLTVCDRILVLCEGRLTADFSREEATQEAILEAATRFEQVR